MTLTKEASMTEDNDDQHGYLVVVNDEEQYSIWWQDRALPSGWQPEGTRGSRRDCLDHIDRVWVDMRPRSLRERMAHSDTN